MSINVKRIIVCHGDTPLIGLQSLGETKISQLNWELKIGYMHRCMFFVLCSHLEC